MFIVELTVDLFIGLSVDVLVERFFWPLVTLTILLVASWIRFQKAMKCSYDGNLHKQHISYSFSINGIQITLKHSKVVNMESSLVFSRSVNYISFIIFYSSLLKHTVTIHTHQTLTTHAYGIHISQTINVIQLLWNFKANQS